MTEGILLILQDDSTGVSGKRPGRSVSPTSVADWTFVAWNPLNDALQ